MPAYTFETITAEQAAAFGGSDTLSFSNAEANINNVSVVFFGDIVTVSQAGRQVKFGAGFSSEVRTITTPNGSAIVIGTAANDALVSTAKLEAFYGGAGNDTVFAGAGDRITGGDGVDLFVFTPGQSDGSVRDFQTGEHIAVGNVKPTLLDYRETTTTGSALDDATGAIATGEANFVLIRSGTTTVTAFVDSFNNNTVGNSFTLEGVSFGMLDHLSFITSPNPPGNPGPTPAPTPAPSPGSPPSPSGPPLLPPQQVVATSGVTVEGNMDLIRPGDLVGALIVDASDKALVIRGSSASTSVGGIGFTYSNNQLVGGVATSVSFSGMATAAFPNAILFSAVAVSFPAVSLGFWVGGNDALGALSTILGGNDNLGGSTPSSVAPGADLIRAFSGNDVIRGGGGADTIFGGTGDDVIYAHGVGSSPVAASTYLRGDEGNDYIIGSIGFDDINGNAGNDTASGGIGDDWVVGGKDNDLLFGDAGGDLVYGNLGDDTCEGGEGDDIVRGGQGNDLVFGDAGDDFVSGDKGDDTMVGGAGADIFHTFGDAGIDRVTDFRLAEGDRVMVDPGTQYTVAQVGADTVVSMTGGGQMVLVGVQMSTLTPGWVFGA